ncbi:MAG: DUF975 family protein [Oscillospiraceae bacterium]|nr:DUF975 family protein [Oscillospiraceae bacterium]
MKTRQEIKELAKQAMKEQQGTCILIALLVAAAGIIGSLLGLTPIIGPMISIVVSLCLIVVNVGLCGAFVSVWRRQKIDVVAPFETLKVNFARKLGGMYWMALWTLLWTYLFIIPGIIKGLAYSMTPYILADCPNVTATDALKLSMRMTKGYKGELFVFHLSYIGWWLLSALTFGILTLVYVTPYYSTAMAGYYEELRERAVASGALRAEELA